MMIDQSVRLYALSPEQLTEVCVRFAVFMGWTRGPGSQDWRDNLRHCISAKSVNELLSSARDNAVSMTAHEGLTTDRQSLERLEARDAG
jgi:hypothetical protein